MKREEIARVQALADTAEACVIERAAAALAGNAETPMRDRQAAAEWAQIATTLRAIVERNAA